MRPDIALPPHISPFITRAIYFVSICLSYKWDMFMAQSTTKATSV